MSCPAVVVLKPDSWLARLACHVHDVCFPSRPMTTPAMQRVLALAERDLRPETTKAAGLILRRLTSANPGTVPDRVMAIADALKGLSDDAQALVLGAVELVTIRPPAAPQQGSPA